MSKIHVNDPEDFATYPNNRVCAIVDDRDDAQRTLEALLDNGINTEHVGILFGEDGANVLDAQGTHHGTLAKVARVFRSFGDVENESMYLYESALHHGGYVFAVHAANDDQKEEIRKALGIGHAREINFFSTWYVQAMRRN